MNFRPILPVHRRTLALALATVCASPVVFFHNGEGPESILEGFRIKDGLASGDSGGGVVCFGASPTIDG